MHGFGLANLGFKVKLCGFRCLGFGFTVPGFGFKVMLFGLDVAVLGSGCRFFGFKVFGVWGSGFRVFDLRFLLFRVRVA